MGVDYLQCDGCQTGYRDDSDYACYCDCGNSFCSKECGKLDNYLDPATQEEPEEDDPAYQDFLDGECHIDKTKPITCVVCRYESHTDYVLLEAVIKHFNITKEIAINIWKANKSEKNKVKKPNSAE